MAEWQYFMQALFAGPLYLVHPRRSPNCKTRAGCDSQAIRRQLWPGKGPGMPGSILGKFSVSMVLADLKQAQVD